MGSAQSRPSEALVAAKLAERLSALQIKEIRRKQAEAEKDYVFIEGDQRE